MTVEEFYKWAVKNDCEDKKVVIYAHDKSGSKVRIYLDEPDLKKLNVSVVINHRWEETSNR